MAVPGGIDHTPLLVCPGWEARRFHWPEKVLRQRLAAVRNHKSLYMGVGAGGDGRNPAVSTTNVKGVSLKTSLKVVFFPKMEHWR